MSTDSLESGDRRQPDGEAADEKRSGPDVQEVNGPDRSRLTRFKRRISKHKGEIFWAIVFAAVLAWPAARIVDPPEHLPYKIVIVEYNQTDDDTQKMFGNLASQWSKDPPKIGDVPVGLVITRPRDNTVEAIKEKTEELVRDRDTLMVIGHLPSGLTEAALPIYFGVRPQVPYISTTASDDNLLVQCQDKCSDEGFVPLLQPSPRNSDQAESAVRFAVQNKKSRFLIVTEEDRENDSYSQSMVQGFRRAIDKMPGTGVVGTHSIGPPPSEQELREWNPDCILYAGRASAAETLLHSLPHRQELMVILSDSVVETRGNNERLAALTSVRFTYPTDAVDYNRHVSVYGQDAISISKQLIRDLDRKGGSAWFRLTSFIHLETINTARKNLVQIMRENAQGRTWYVCASTTVCVFDQHKRLNGMFHVWQIDGRNDVGRMLDIDGWHPPRAASEN